MVSSPCALIVEPEAEQELAAAIRWYEDQQPGLGAALMAEIDQIIARLRDRPEQ